MTQSHFSKPIDSRLWELASVNQFQVQEKYKNHLDGILIPGGFIKDRVRRQAEELSAMPYKGSIVMICMIQGAMDFFVDLRRRITHPTETILYGASSYNGTSSTGNITIYGFDPTIIPGRHVVIVEDISDTGRTLAKAQKDVNAHDPQSLTTICLLEKPGVTKVANPTIDSIGFLVPNKFVIGAGLDYMGRYRDLYHLGVLKPEYIDPAHR
jgi:hypoxanthine phosphoribosyltransferase